MRLCFDPPSGVESDPRLRSEKFSSGINSSAPSTQEKTRLLTRIITKGRKKRNLNLGSSSKNSSITQDRWAAAMVKPTKRQLLHEFANFTSFKGDARESKNNLSSERSDVSESKNASEVAAQRHTNSGSSTKFRAYYLAS